MGTYTVLGGRLHLHQGTPASPEEALWLAAAIPPLPAGTRVLDAACGNGVAALALLTRQPRLRVTGVDVNPALTAAAAANAALNRLPLTVLTANLLLTPPPAHQVVLCNPPFHLQTRGHTAGGAARAAVSGVTAGGEHAWLAALLACTTQAGHLHLITHASWGQALRQAAQTYALRATVTPLATSATRSPKRVLVHLTRAAAPAWVENPPLPAYNPALRQAVLHQGLPLPALPLPGG